MANRKQVMGWTWSQHWQDLLFLHWRVDIASLQSHVPAPLEVATYAGDAWVSLVVFRLRVRPRWLPYLPVVSDLVEVNLRTYVNCQGLSGIWFLSVHADNSWAVRLARILTPIPYEHAAMRYRRRGEEFQFQANSAKAGDLADLIFRPTGNASRLEERSLDEWLLERYRLFALDGRGALVHAEVAHPRWNAQGVAVSISANRFGRAAGLDLGGLPVLAHFANGTRARFGRFRRGEVSDQENHLPLDNSTLTPTTRGSSLTPSYGAASRSQAPPGNAFPEALPL